MSSLNLIYTILTSALICLNSLYGYAQKRAYPDLTDSLRQEIRLCSWVLIPVDSANQYKQIIDSNIPVVFDGREASASDCAHIQDMAAQDSSIIILSDQQLPEQLNAIQIKSTDYDQYFYSALNFSDSAKNDVFSHCELLLVETKDSLLSDDDLLHLWQIKGKKPNFISAKNISIQQLTRIVEQLNQQRKIFGVVASEDGLLYNVLRKDMPEAQLNGYFCLPALSRLFVEPYKAGYQFSPDIISYSSYSEKNFKKFKGIRLTPDFKLNDHFVFDKNIKNICHPGYNDFIIQNVRFVDDSILGQVAYFQKAYIDAGLKSRNSLNSTFTISVWIKPTELTYNNSILGKGNNFVLKLHEGNLTFTMAGIKDYISINSSIPLEQWTHVAVVYSALACNLSFYLNGKKTDQIKMIADYSGSEHSLIIGNNIWEESFCGYIGEIKIWERELNDKEIKNDFLSLSNQSKSQSWIPTFILGLIILVILILISFKRRKQKKGIKSGQSISNDSSKEKKGMQIQCFGTLCVFQHERELASALSPKLKQLFVLILLHSAPGKRGISSKKMSDFLWPGMNPSNAKNIRGTNMQNLRHIFNDCSEIAIVFKDKMWQLELADEVYCDYFEMEKLLQNMGKKADSISKNDLKKLVDILKSGKLLSTIESSWLDYYKEHFSSRLLEICLSALSRLKGDSSLQFELAEIISIYDELNETALQIKIQILNAQGKHGLAKSVYQNYVKLYQELYNCEYPLEFLELLKTDK